MNHPLAREESDVPILYGIYAARKEREGRAVNAARTGWNRSRIDYCGIDCSLSFSLPHSAGQRLIKKPAHERLVSSRVSEREYIYGHNASALLQAFSLSLSSLSLRWMKVARARATGKSVCYYRGDEPLVNSSLIRAPAFPWLSFSLSALGESMIKSLFCLRVRVYIYMRAEVSVCIVVADEERERELQQSRSFLRCLWGRGVFRR